MKTFNVKYKSNLMKEEGRKIVQHEILKKMFFIVEMSLNNGQKFENLKILNKTFFFRFKN